MVDVDPKDVRFVGGHVRSGVWRPLSHYYGDVARQLMLGAAALMLFASPFYADNLRVEFPFEVFGTLVLVCLAAFTNPLKKSVLTADAIATGVGLTLYQIWALAGYEQSSLVAFVLRECIAVIFLFAFYFSVKTVRAMILHQVGQKDTSTEFGDEPPAHAAVKEDEFISNVDQDFSLRDTDEGAEVRHHRPTFNEKAGD